MESMQEYLRDLQVQFYTTTIKQVKVFLLVEGLAFNLFKKKKATVKRNKTSYNKTRYSSCREENVSVNYVLCKKAVYRARGQL